METLSRLLINMCVVLLLLLLALGLAVAFNYADAVTKSIIYFEDPRSGKLPPGNRMAGLPSSASPASATAPSTTMTT
jgi:hypothetical protein